MAEMKYCYFYVTDWKHRHRSEKCSIQDGTRTWWQSHRSPLLAPISQCFTSKIFPLTRGLWSQRQFREGGSAHRHTRIFKQKLEILRGWAVSGMGPCLSLQPPKTGALLGSMLQSWYTACSSTTKILLPAHSVATDSLYRQSLHHCGCFSPLSSFLCPAGEKHCADCPVLTHMLEWWNLSSPCPPAHLHQDILGPVGGLGEEGGKSIVCLSAKNAEESLPSRGGQGALSNRLCSDAAFGTHRPAPLMQVQGWLSSCQTDLVLCC